MKNNSTSSEETSDAVTYKVHGVVRDAYQQLMPNATVSIYNKTMRGKTLLGTAATATDGSYSISYTIKNTKTAGLIVGVYDAKGNALKENDVLYDIPEDLQADFDLSGRQLAGVADYDRLMELITPFTEDTPLVKMTETVAHPDLSFVAKKTGLSLDAVEQLAMAARFETFSAIPAYVWYGILRAANTNKPTSADFEGKVNQLYDVLMHSTVDSLITSLQSAINANTIAYHYMADVPEISKKLNAQIIAYAKQHPVTGEPSALLQKLHIGGLKGADIEAFITAKINHAGTEGDFWEKLEHAQVLNHPAKAGAVKATMQVAAITGNNLSLTQTLVNDHKITAVADIKQLAGYTHQEWVDLLKKNDIEPDSNIPGKTHTEKIKNYAAQLDAAFTSAYPTAAYAARLQKDKTSKLPIHEKVSKFLQKNEDFDLLNHHVGSYIKNKPAAVTKKDAAEVTDHIRRIQRVMKLTPSYESSSVLLNDNIHSAQQIYKMGQENFVKTYGDKLGENKATQVFQQAAATHATALAFTSNLKSMADASSIKAFPDFSATIAQQLAADIPNLDTLFGHADFCECDECSSVYGASAYLTDILHYLQQRQSTLKAPNAGVSAPTVKDILLRRRPDLGYIDLNCDNTNTLVPYIDIACELMEDYIAPPVITLTFAQASALEVGQIAPALLSALKTQFIAAGQTNVASLLTSAAIVSDNYTVVSLKDDDTYHFQTENIIRDAQIALKVSSDQGLANAPAEVRVLHQTFQDADTINAGPEYVNINVYNNFLAKAKTPYSLPFDLNETEGELYLQQLGISKADLIDIFRKEDHTAPGTSVADIKIGYASLGINLAEQTLIFTADPTHQSLYWGATITKEAQIDVFQGITGLTYDQILDLISLQFINPKKDTVIQHDDLVPDVTKQRLINLDTTKLDAMHRFLRLWRKTTFSMAELDAIIMSPKMGNGAMPTKLPYLIHLFTDLQQKLQLSVFELLAFYQNIDTTHNQPNSLYNQLFQNSAVTNPVSANFSIATATAGTTGIVEADKSVLAAILQIPVSDVNLLLAKTNSKISLANLSVMFHCAKLAQGLDITITDLLTLTNLIDANPFVGLVSTTLFINKYNLLKSSGFSIDELNYILRHQDDAAHTLVPSAGQITNALTQVQTEFIAINSANQPAPDANGQLLTKWLSDGVFNWDRGMLSRLVDILNTVDDTVYLQKLTANANFLNNLRLVYHDSLITADLPALPLDKSGKKIVVPASIAAQLSYDDSGKQLRFTGYMSAADHTALLALVTGSTTDPNVALYTAAINAIFTKAQQTDNSAANVLFTTTNTIDKVLKVKIKGDTAGRFSYFINLVSPVYIKLLQQNSLIKDISNWFSVDKKVTTQLLASIPGIYTDLSAANFIGKVVPVTNAVQVNRYLSLAKICFIIAKLKLTDTELAFQVAHAVDISSLDIASLPITPVTAAVTTFPTFEAFVNLLRFDQNYPAKVINEATGATISIYSIITDAVAQKKAAITGAALTTWTASMIADLALLTDWNKADLTTLIGAGGNIATLALPADIYSAPILMRLNQRLTMQQQLGINISDAFIWTKDGLTAADTAKIKQVTKSKYVNSDWLQISKTIQDKLREKKRDALIAYLLANPGTQNWETAEDLYAFFLMDVQMCSCQPTSRIVQATNTIQLFVQRCFMQLEPDVLIDTVADSVWGQWDWMKNFRVWQANKKVFLWPENYIEPELLPVDIKSSFFTELENDLLQGEVNADTVTTAFENYAQKLSEVAKLEVKNHYYDDFSKTLHVFARTYGGDPKTYYYRRFIEGRRWTPWEMVNLDIAGEYIIPVVYNNNVYLYWPVFKLLPNVTDPKGLGTWQLQLAFSQYKNGKWSQKKVSEYNADGTLTFDQQSFPDASRFFFVTFDIPDVTWLDANGKAIGGQAQIDLQKKSALKNGTMIINCHYFDPNVTPRNAFANKFVGGFQLNAIGGYPSKPTFNISGFNMQLWKTSTLTNDQDGAFNFINMFDTEATTPAAPVLPGSTTPLPNQLRTNYKISAALQPSYAARINFMAFLRPDWLAIAPDGPAGHFMRYFLQDKNRVYYVRPEITDNQNVEYVYENFLDEFLSKVSNGTPVLSGTKNRDRFFNFYHPQIGFLMQQLFLKGIDGLLDRNTQLVTETTFNTYFKDLYHVKNDIVYTGDGGPKDDVDFSPTAAFSLYNWELFYHAPLMIAERLSQNQQFDDADRWYKYIFNPLDTSDKPAPNKFWNTKPFFETTSDEYLAQRIDAILATGNRAPTSLINDLNDWRYDPFQPHLIAQHRTVAYQKVAVMKYIGHLIRYGDYLFAQDTMESVNQATQLYILASEILGPKPQTIPSPVVQPVDNYNQLGPKLDTLSDALVSVENLLPYQSVTGFVPTQQGLPTLFTQYFCLPMNENLTGPTGYWDVITDRLFKIRHCLNINGTLAPLALFAPVIDPALLVRATAAGLDLGSILNDLNAPLPIYRFAIISQKATELCNEVKSLGSLLLAVLEKKDAEALSLLRNSQETKLLKAVSLLKKKQIDDAQAVIELLVKQKESAMQRKTYYSGLISIGLNSKEKKALDLNKTSFELDEAAAVLYLGSSIANHEPTLILGAIVGTPGGSVNTAKFGGETVGGALANMGRNAGSIATALDKKAGLTSVNAGYERRLQEWQLQLDLANKDLEQFDKQIANAQLRLEIAQTDADNQQLQIDQSQETADFFKSKYTNQDLYNFMITQVSNTYFKSYQLAYKVAKQAEQCFRYELGLEDSAYINFGYWDSLRKGLTSGEQLFYDIKAMEVAYLDQNKRDLELTKSISLLQLDPVALYKLKTTGECWLNLPEELFDMDYPGHYMRRIKSVSLTIPCIAGPYTTVSAKLTMTNNSMRTSPLAATDAAQYSRKMTTGSAPVPTDDPRFRDSVGALQSISTSSAQNDSGLFELNFRDERYLPFEGAGAISLWHLELPSFVTVKQFDFDTISDVIIHLKYTARDGGDLLKANAATSLKTKINQMLVSTKDTGLMRVLSAKNDLATEWYRFLNPANTTDDQVLTVNLDKSRFPLFVQDKAIKIKSVELIAFSTATAINGLVVTPAPSAPAAVNLTKTNIYGANNLSVTMTYNNDPGTWVIKNPAAKARLTADVLDNLVMIVHYTVS